MADLKPFRAVRYTGAAGPAADLVAPPYDAVTPEERDRLLRRSPYNVLHLTLPESAEEAARLYREWLAGGILEREAEPASWLLVEDYVGPDGVARRRQGVVVSLAAEPFGTGGVLPHEHTYSGVREGRTRLLDATRVQPEPIFMLLDGGLDIDVPTRPAELEVDGTRLWRLEDFDLASLAGAELLIADGHHRYESALGLDVEQPRIMALLVSTQDPGLHVFPTHRTFAGRADLRELQEGDLRATLDDALEALAQEPREHAAVVAYRGSGARLVRGGEGELDAELVDRHGREGIAYTPQVDEAVAAVDRGHADVAFLLREPRVDEIFAVARRGERMPPKSTYFFPKPLSGVLFHPLES